MLGRVNIINSGGGTFQVTFNTTPTTATVIVKNEKEQVVQAVENKTYKLRQGVYTYEVSAEGYETVQAEIGVLKEMTIDVKLELSKIVSFSAGTDEAIAKMLHLHYLGEIDISDYWTVGDTRKIHLNRMSLSNIETHVAQDIMITIIGIKHDTLKEQIGTRTKAAITVQCRECLGNNGTIELGGLYDNSGTNIYKGTKFENSKRESWLNTTFINALPVAFNQTTPETFYGTVKSVNKTHYYDSKGSQTTGTTLSKTTVSEKAFILSYIEITGKTTVESSTVAPSDGTVYEYYKTTSNRVKFINKNGQSGNTCEWWTRTVADTHYGYSDNGYLGAWCSIKTDGSGKVNLATIKYGLAPAFCL